MLFLSFKLLQIKVPRYVLAPQPRGQVRSSQLDRKYQQIFHENIVDSVESIFSATDPILSRLRRTQAKT